MHQNGMRLAGIPASRFYFAALITIGRENSKL